jgi:hypothetical protein
MKLKVGQHIYGRNKERGFSTLGYSLDVTRENVNLIERNCNYELPTSMYYDDGIEKPAKYTFYKLDEERVVIGKGVYIGKDEFGRVGNYIFHNLIFQTKDLTRLEINPVSLIRCLEKMKIFTLEPPLDEKPEFLELSLEKDDITFPFNSQMLPQSIMDRLPDLIYLCLDPKIKDPIIIEYNKESEIFNFLHQLFFITPKRMWKEFSFNTLWYKDYAFLIHGIKKGFPLPSNHSAKIDLEEDLYELKTPIQNKARYEYAKLVAKKALNDKQGLSDLYLLQELAETAAWNRFIELYGDAPPDIKNVIYENNREAISTEVSQGNIGLFKALKRDISKEDLNRVFKSKKMIDRLLENRDEIIARDFVEWFYDMLITEDKRNIYPVFLSNVWLFDLLLNKIRQEMSKNIEIVQNLLQGIYMQYAEQKRYNEVIEEKVLEIFCELLENSPDIDTTGTLKVVKKLPPSNNPKVLLLRALIRYRLEDSSELISLIKEKEYQPLLFELLNNGMNATDWERHKKVFQQNEPKPSILKFWR